MTTIPQKTAGQKEKKQRAEAAILDHREEKEREK